MSNITVVALYRLYREYQEEGYQDQEIIQEWGISRRQFYYYKAQFREISNIPARC